MFKKPVPIHVALKCKPDGKIAHNQLFALIEYQDLSFKIGPN